MNVEAIRGTLESWNFQKAVWLLPAAFALHALEEAPQFAAWVNRYASPMFTRGDFIRNNALGMAMGVAGCLLLRFFLTRPMVFVFYVAVLTQCFYNTFFHVATTAAFGVYSPGVITSLVLYPPLFYHLTRLAYREGLLSNQLGITAMVMGAAIHSGVVARQVFFLF